jgi:hypothetical protein
MSIGDYSQARRQFVRDEVLRRARFEYGLHPYEPARPVTIERSWVEYKCHCGFSTTSSGEIFDHCMAHDTPMQADLFGVAG